MSKNPFVQMDTIEGSGEGVWGDEPQEKGAKKKSKMKNPFDLDASDGEEEEKKAKGEGGRRMGDGNEKLPVTYPVRKGLDTFDVCFSFFFFFSFFLFFFFSFLLFFFSSFLLFFFSSFLLFFFSSFLLFFFSSFLLFFFSPFLLFFFFLLFLSFFLSPSPFSLLSIPPSSPSPGGSQCRFSRKHGSRQKHPW